MTMNSKRVEWVDIFKGLLIVLVVLGHSNNVKLIPLIYAFHMAAFFFIHGYTTNYEKDNFIDYFKKRFKGLAVPFFTFNIAVYFLQMFLNFIGVYDYFYVTPFDYHSILNFIRYFWTFDLAGATWFLIVLFFASIVSKIIYDCLREKMDSSSTSKWHLIITTSLFLFFYLCFYRVQIVAAYFLDLVPISLLFVSIGNYLKNINEKDNKYLIHFIKLIFIIGYFIIVLVLHEQTEWSIRVLPNVIFLIVESLGGIFLFEYISKFFVHFKDRLKIVYKTLIYIGSNTLAVLKYHFLGFRLVFLVGVICGVLKINSLQYLTPPYTSFMYTTITSIVSIIFCLCFDKIISYIKRTFKWLKGKIKIKMSFKNIYKVVLILTLFIFLNIFIYSFFSPSNVYYSENNFISLTITAIMFIILYFIYKKLIYNKTNIGKKKEILIVIPIFIIILLIQLFVLNNLSVIPSWDFGVIFREAESYVLTGTRNVLWYPSYFEFYPNNMLLFAMLVKVLKVGSYFGISFMHSAWIMNVVFITLSYVMLYFTLRKKFGNRVAIFGLLISLLFVAPFLYSSIFYSDTLSMFVGISFIFLYYILDFEHKVSIKNVIVFIIFGILLFYGKSIKITSIIPFIAIMIAFVLDQNKRKVLINLFFTCLVFLILSSAFKIMVVDNTRFAFKEGTYGSFPYTHWVMMGIEDIDRDNSGRNSYGGYNPEDYNYTLSFENGKEASKHNIEEIKNRIKKMGFMGYYNYLCKKAVNTWTDGLFFADVKLQKDNIHKDEKIYNAIFNNSTNKNALIYFSQGVEYLFLISLMIGSVIKLFRNNRDFDVVRLSIIGICFFLLIWENRSRYLLNFVPLFIYIICELYVLIGTSLKIKDKKNT